MWIRSSARPSSSSSGSSAHVERDGQARRSLGEGPAFAGAPLDEHLVGPELMARDAEPPAGERLEVAVGELGPDPPRAPCRASGRARAGSASRAARSPRPGRTRRLHAQLVYNNRRRDLRAPAPCATSRRSGWRSLSPASRAGRRPSSTTRAHVGHLRRSSGRRPRAPRASRPGSTEAGASAQPRQRGSATDARAGTASPGATTRSACTSAYQSVAKAAGIAVPEALPRAADVPVGEVVDERLEGARSARVSEALVGRPASRASCCARDHPAVERCGRRRLGPSPRSAASRRCSRR